MGFYRTNFVFVIVLIINWGIVESGLGLRLSKSRSNNAAMTITVDRFGHGNFTTIQSAIDSIPSNNNQWIRIHVGLGIFREKVVIPSDKPFILLEGEGRDGTSIEWGEYSPYLNDTPTFSSCADHFIARRISFKNTYNHVVYPGNNNPRHPAVAALILGDKSSFYECGFYGLQDTLWDAQGLHYFKDCYIEGAVDFIFGMGQSIYETCAISVIAGGLHEGSPGYITAQGRRSTKETNGFVFKYCNVFGTGKAYLGRPWRSHSRVLFFKSKFSDVVDPIGWDAWRFTGQEDQISYSEYDCTGPGSDKSQRVKWEKKLSRQELNMLSSTQYFIDKERWLEHQP